MYEHFITNLNIYIYIYEYNILTEEYNTRQNKIFILHRILF